MLLLILLPLMAFCVPFNDPLRDPFPYFISGDAFRVHCDFVFDDVDRSLNPSSVTAHSKVFVHGDFLAEYVEKIHPTIAQPYVLVTHNSDLLIPGPYAALLDDEKIIAWCGIHVETPHPKLHPIPLGIANRYLPFGNVDIIKKVLSAPPVKAHLLYFNLTIQNYLPERWATYQLFQRAPFCYRPIKKRFEYYLADVMSSKFIASPRGIGLDTYRLWESLYVGSYPVVKSSSLDVLYQDLPVLIVQDWKQVSETFLNETYDAMEAKTYDKSKLDISYWLKYIDSF